MKTNFRIVSNKKDENSLIVNDNNEIIYDTALIDCMNELNALRDSENKNDLRTENDILGSINQISAEMRWFSQWLAVKSSSAA